MRCCGVALHRLALASLLLSCGVVWTASGERNIALHRPCVLSPAPSYPHCTDGKDAEQITDGFHGGSHWTSMSTVGWRHASVIPRIRIDLGKVQAISAVHIHTVGGGFAGVYVPRQVAVLVSDDGERFEAVAVRNGEQRGGRAVAAVVHIDSLQATGRYVLVLLAPAGRFVFLDEVTVIGGVHSGPDVPERALATYAIDDAEAVFAVESLSRRVSDEYDRLMQEMQTAARVGIDDPAFMAEMRTDLHELRQGIALAVPFRSADWDAVEASLRTVRGRWLRKRWGRRLMWHHANPMESSDRGDVFFDNEDRVDELVIEMWAGEYESAAVTLVNCSARRVSLRAKFSAPQADPGKRDVVVEAVTLRRVVFVDGPDQYPIGDALVKLGDHSIDVQAGSAAQLWLTVHHSDLSRGEYPFVIDLQVIADGEPAEREQIVGRIIVHPIRFPERVSLKTYNWCYLSQFGLDRDHLDDVVRDLKQHYVNVFVVHPTNLPRATALANGSLSLDFVKHDEILATFADAEEYLFFWGYEAKQKTLLREWGEWMSPAWNRAMRQYLKDWVVHLRELGIGFDRFAIYPYDETLGDEFFKVAKFIRDVEPRIRIFANSVGRRPRDVDSFLPYVDTWCLPDLGCGSLGDSCRKLRGSGKVETWRYAASVDARELSPLGYYRLQPWRAWRDGDTGCGFWTYATIQGRALCSDWNDYSCDRHGVVYAGRSGNLKANGEVVVPSRRWEAWREGIEDYEYLHVLQERIETCVKEGCSDTLVRASRETLVAIVQEVLADTEGADRVYEARRRITAQIQKLNAALAAEKGAR